MTDQIEIHTNRLILKGITPDFIHHIYNTKSKEEIIQYFGFDEQSYEHYRQMHEKGMETHRLSLYVFLLIEKDSKLPIGECGFHTWNKSHDRAELFYSLRKDQYKQKGFMTEAVQVVLDFGFNQMNLHRVEANVADWNTPSVKLLQRNGFTKEGTKREDYLVDGNYEDSESYSLLKREWKK